MLPLKWRQTFWCVLVRQICVCVWNFIVVAVRYCLGQQGGWCQMGVSEASCVDEVRWLCLKLHWFTFDKVRRLFLKLHHVGCDPSNICFWGGSLLMKSDVCFWGWPLVIWRPWSESLKSLSECWCLSSATRLRRLMPWCCWALWVFININIAYR